MAAIKTAISFILMMVSILFNTFDALIPGFIPEPKSEEELVEIVERFDEYSLADEITVVKQSSFSNAEMHTVIALQGLVSRTSPAIFIDYGNDANKFALSELEKAGYELAYNDENGNPWNFESIIERFKSYITDSGYILYATPDNHGQLNTAINLATINGWLPISADLEEVAVSLGHEKRADISKDNIDLAYLKAFYNEYKNCFRNDTLVHLYYYAKGMRDFAIQQNIFVIYIEDADYEGRLFRDKIMRELEPASFIFGWCQYEIKFTESASRFGHCVIPSDHSYNLSLLASFDSNDEKIGSVNDDEVELDPSKHYVAIVYSDGDNAQWIQNGFSEYHKWQSYNSDVPVTWTYAPIISEISDVDVMRTLGALKKGAFITGPSGGGYARIINMNPAELEAFSDLTAAMMQESGMTVMTLLDEIKDGTFEVVMPSKLRYFARYENIHGGILQLDPNNYAGGGGKVYFVNDKPFVTVGHSLWYPSGNADDVTNEWLAEQAAIINAKPADITSINGYTVINVHPWTVGPDDLAYFVSQLGDNVEVITANQMINALSENIPHKNAKPE
ncbi:MAG: hypothetical protein IKM25_04725 [Clostridia bacterium]|nr:hypothetical protein [Clostridia bacterium]